jgi:4-hydroxy-tetrahydrodipicolinate synthase
MPPVKVQGVCPIVATPFDSNGNVDYAGLRAVIRWLAAGGCPAVTLFGIAGEYYKLTDEERRRIIEAAVEECRRAGVGSVVSVTDHSTEAAVRQAQYTESAGADVVMLLPPFFLKPSPAAVCEHTLAVARAVSLPIMLQYAPEQTGVGIPPETLAQLAREAPNVCIFKVECRPPGGYISRLLEITGGAVSVLSGNAGFQMIETYDRGAVGVMPGCSMFDLYLRIDRHYRRGERAEALSLHGKLLPMLNHIRQDVEMIIAYEKRILQRRGVIASDACRRPTFRADARHDGLFEDLWAALEPELQPVPQGNL